MHDVVLDGSTRLAVSNVCNVPSHLEFSTHPRADSPTHVLALSAHHPLTLARHCSSGEGERAVDSDDEDAATDAAILQRFGPRAGAADADATLDDDHNGGGGAADSDMAPPPPLRQSHHPTQTHPQPPPVSAPAAEVFRAPPPAARTKDPFVAGQAKKIIESTTGTCCLFREKNDSAKIFDTVLSNESEYD